MEKKIDFFQWRPHPWHGLETGSKPPQILNAYVEITPYDLVKYEVDKTTGYLRVDRPQRSSSLPPTLYGLVPKTYCGKGVAALAPGVDRGDGDPLDICIISERPINRSEVILESKVIGGLLMIDNGEADDKIIAVLSNDKFWSDTKDISEVPKVFIERMKHYFSTYKMIPGKPSPSYIEKQYNHKHAYKVIEASIKDYNDLYG